MTTITPDTASPGSVSRQTATQQGIGEEFNSFIQLLTAQIQNQDPLSPLDSTQFVEQLATFSTLEQQVRSNTSLEFIAATMNDLHTMLASEWIGQSVTVESSWVPYSGEGIDFSFDAPSDTDRAVLTIRDPNGNVTWSETLDHSDELHQWDGQTDTGTPAAPDTLHQFSIDLYRQGNYIGSVAPRVVTTVTDVASENGKLRVGTAMQLSADIAAIRKIEK